MWEIEEWRSKSNLKVYFLLEKSIFIWANKKTTLDDVWSCTHLYKMAPLATSFFHTFTFFSSLCNALEKHLESDKMDKKWFIKNEYIDLFETVF